MRFFKCDILQNLHPLVDKSDLEVPTKDYNTVRIAIINLNI